MGTFQVPTLRCLSLSQAASARSIRIDKPGLAMQASHTHTHSSCSSCLGCACRFSVTHPPHPSPLDVFSRFSNTSYPGRLVHQVLQRADAFQVSASGSLHRHCQLSCGNLALRLSTAASLATGGNTRTVPRLWSRCPGAALALPWRCPELFDWQEYAGPTGIFHVLFQTRTRTFSALDSHCGIQSRAVPASSRKSGLSPRASVRIQYGCNMHELSKALSVLSVRCMETSSTMIGEKCKQSTGTAVHIPYSQSSAGDLRVQLYFCTVPNLRLRFLKS